MSVKRLLLLCLLLPLPAAAQHNVSRYAVFMSNHQQPALACLGLVKEDNSGKPASIARISDETCAPANTLNRITWLSWMQHATAHPGVTAETQAISPSELAERILPPVPLSQFDLDSEAAYVVGVGLNYLDHRLEVGVQPDTSDWQQLLFFPKSVVPTGPYGEIEKGLRLGSVQAKDVQLMDYEVELAFVLFEHIDLNQAAEKESLFAKLGFFASNDVSDREPIILDNVHGYTQGKTHPGYLPTGPWLVKASDVPQVLALQDEQELALSLKVEDQGISSTRQQGSSMQMIWEPVDIVNTLARYYQQGVRLCMRDSRGQKRYLYDEQGRIPAGSIFLTGTPGGTAIKAPAWYSKMGLFMQGGFSIRGARQEYLDQQIEEQLALGYLQAGQRMTTEIEMLGRQEHHIVNTQVRTPYGVLLQNADCSYPLP